jgi:hypothetical protein
VLPGGKNRGRHVGLNVERVRKASRDTMKEITAG